MFADTSFLFSLYRAQTNSTRADRLARSIRAPLLITSLVRFEFRQSIRLHVFRFASDRTQGFPKREALAMLKAFEQNADAGVFRLAPIDWPDVHDIAEKLSSEATMEGGYRVLDILHVACALHLREKTFLTFDQSQEKLARRAGLTVPK